jgi:hypothetical protein
MKKIVSLTESELTTLVKKIIKENNDYLVSEALGGGKDMSSEDRMKKKYPNGFQIPYTVTAAGGSTFANGVDTINKNDSKIKEILTTISDLLKTTTGKVNVVVNGGASAVGSLSGYDNKALAARRRDNLIKLIKGNWTTTRLVVIPGTAVVGKETQINSQAARKEQYVSASIYGEKTQNIPIKVEKGDNTNVYIPDIYRKDKKRFEPTPVPIDNNRKKKICITIPVKSYSSFNKYFKEFAKANGLSNIPWSEKDV